LSFKEIAGNEQIKKILKLSLSKGRLPNSLLFAGPPGVGKLKAAANLAKALNCLELKDDCCDRCDSCLRIDRGQHPNVRIISREKNREQIVKEQIDEINYLSRLRPWNQGKLVFIIDEADRMNETVANSLLKTLEEPRPFVYFILVTEDLPVILPTIRSRCQVLKFKPISQEDIEKALINRGLSEDRASLIAMTTDGNLELALSLSWDEFIAGRDRAWLLFKKMVEVEEAEHLLNLTTGRAKKDILGEFKKTLSFFSVFFRDLILISQGETRYLLNSDLRSELVAFSPVVPVEKAVSGVKQIEDFLNSLKKNPNLSIMSYELAIFFREIKDA
jgi:DNA polymerase-3 subunit delta'